MSIEDDLERAVDKTTTDFSKYELRDRAIGVLLDQVRDTNQRLNDLFREIKEINLRLAQGDARMGRIEENFSSHTKEEKHWAEAITKDLAKNTDATQVIADGATTLRMIKKVVVWVGGVAGGVAAVVYLVALWSGTNIGPGP